MMAVTNSIGRHSVYVDVFHRYVSVNVIWAIFFILMTSRLYPGTVCLLLCISMDCPGLMMEWISLMFSKIGSHRPSPRCVICYCGWVDSFWEPTFFVRSDPGEFLNFSVLVYWSFYIYASLDESLPSSLGYRIASIMQPSSFSRLRLALRLGTWSYLFLAALFKERSFWPLAFLLGLTTCWAFSSTGIDVIRI